jgi:2'-5' RNA ligase
VIEEYETVPVSWEADRLVLYESTLRRNGAIYTPVEEFVFSSR